MFLPPARREGNAFSPTVATTVQSKAFGPVQINQVKAPLARDEPSGRYQDPGDSLVWAFVTGGEIVSIRGRKDIASPAGNVHMSYMPRLTGFQMTPDFRALSIRIRRDAIPLTSAEVDIIFDTVFPLAEGIPLMLGSMASQVMKMDSALGPVSGAALAQSIIDLTTALVDDFLGKYSPPETIRRNLVVEAKHHVELYSSSPSLTAATVAESLQISARTLQKAFELEPMSLSQVILESRLLRARATLERDRTGEVAIEAIGYRSGFASASSFSRAFRARFGVPPREWRKQHLELAESRHRASFRADLT